MPGTPTSPEDSPSQPYCLLDLIGVDLAWQGKGFGRQMLAAQLRELDQRQMPCYLETSRREIVPYYQHFGFQLIHEYQLVNIPVYSLFRESNACA
jgi:GNAT superfamily N-acetyltransferase